MKRLFALVALIAGCATASAAVLADRAPVATGCDPAGTCKVTWYFHAVGPVPAIVATISVTGSSFLHTDTLPAGATQDTATVPVLPGGSGVACARSSSAPASSASCRSWSAPGAVVVDSIGALSFLLDSATGTKVVALTSTIPAHRKGLFCTYGFCRYGSLHYVTRARLNVADSAWRAAICDSVGRARWGNYRV